MNLNLIKTLTVKIIYKQLLPAILIFSIGWWLSGKITSVICKTLEKAKVDLEIISFSRSVLKYIFRILVLIITLTKLTGVNITSLITALSAASVIAGIALKDSLSNLASGIMIIINKPFKIGNYIETENSFGTVTKIELMFTTLITPDNKEIVIPNSKLTSSNIINCDKNSIRRLDLSYSINNEYKIDTVNSIFNSIISSSDKVLNDLPCSVGISKYDFKQTEFEIKLWCKTEDYNSLKNEFNEQTKRKFEQENKGE